MPSCLLSERLGSALHVGEFVHVREVEGRDKGQLEVYRIERPRAMAGYRITPVLVLWI
jgi:hypothetical protein